MFTTDPFVGMKLCGTTNRKQPSTELLAEVTEVKDQQAKVRIRHLGDLEQEKSHDWWPFAVLKASKWIEQVS